MKPWMLLKHRWIIHHSVIEEAGGGVAWFHGKENILGKMNGKVWRYEIMFNGRYSGEVIVFG